MAMASAQNGVGVIPTGGPRGVLPIEWKLASLLRRISAYLRLARRGAYEKPFAIRERGVAQPNKLALISSNIPERMSTRHEFMGRNYA